MRFQTALMPTGDMDTTLTSTRISVRPIRSRHRVLSRFVAPVRNACSVVVAKREAYQSMYASLFPGSGLCRASMRRSGELYYFVVQTASGLSHECVAFIE